MKAFFNKFTLAAVTPPAGHNAAGRVTREPSGAQSTGNAHGAGQGRLGLNGLPLATPFGGRTLPANRLFLHGDPYGHGDGRASSSPPPVCLVQPAAPQPVPLAAVANYNPPRADWRQQRDRQASEAWWRGMQGSAASPVPPPTTAPSLVGSLPRHAS